MVMYRQVCPEGVQNKTPGGVWCRGYMSWGDTLILVISRGVQLYYGIAHCIQQTKNFTTTEHSNPDDALQKLTYQVSQLEVQLKIISDFKRNHCILVAGEICKKFETAIRCYVIYGWLSPVTKQSLTPDERKKLLHELPEHLTALNTRCNQTDKPAIQERWKEICELLEWKPDHYGNRRGNVISLLTRISKRRNDIAHPDIKLSEVNVEELQSYADLSGIGYILKNILKHS